MTIALDNFSLVSFLEDERTASANANRVAESVIKEVEKERVARKVDVKKNWDLFQGDHEKYFKIRKNEDDQVFKYRKEHASILNYCQFIVNLGAKFAYGRPEKVRRRFSKDVDKTETEDKMRRMENLIGIQSFMLTTKRYAGIFGEQAIRFLPIDERTNKKATGRATKTTYPFPMLLDPLLTFPLRNQWGGLDAIVIKDSYTDHVTGLTVDTKELVVDDSRWYWENNVLINAERNLYALNEEFYVFINTDLRKDDIQVIGNLQIRLDEAWTDAAHFFERHGWPQMVSKVDLKDVVHNPNYVWEISPESDNGKVTDEIGFLTWDGKIEDALKYLDMIESSILKLSSTAAIATGDLKSIGQLRSGAALVTAYGPSIQGATEKQVIWDRNEVGFFNALAAFDSRLRNESVEDRYPDLFVQIDFPQDFVPGEELVRAEIDVMEMNSHVTTLREIIRRKNPTLTEEKINDLREESFDDSERLVDSKRAFVTEETVSGDTKQPVSSGKSKSNEQPKQ